MSDFHSETGANFSGANIKGKNILATSPDNRVSTVDIKKVGVIPIESDQAKQKNIVDVSVRSGNISRDAGSFIHKVFYDPEAAQKFVKHHNILKKANLPVLPTVREVDDGVLVTDLTEGGKKTVFSINEVDEGVLNPIGLIRNPQIIRRELDRIVTIAESNDFVIARNAYFVVIDEKGEGHVVLGSYGNNVYLTREEKQANPKAITAIKTRQAADNFFKTVTEGSQIFTYNFPTPKVT